MGNAVIKRTKTYTYKFSLFVYPFSTVEAWTRIRHSRPNFPKKPTCFYCGKEIKDTICVGFGVNTKNKIFHVDCAKILASEYDTEIRKTSPEPPKEDE